jgi:glycosyltransferase involved in cell wall biosynthesis
MRKILHIIWDGNLGGVQRYVQKVITSTEWQNTQNTVLIITKPGEVINEKSLPGIEVISVKVRANFQLRKVYTAVRETVKRLGIEVIHCHCDTLLFMTQLRLFTDCKLVYTEHGDSFVRSKRKVLTELLWKWNGPLWDTIIQNSYYSEKEFVSRFPFLQGTVTVAPNPLLDKVEKEPKRVMSLKPQIGTIGRLSQVKGNDLFLESIPHILKIIPEAHFHIFGDGEEKFALENQALKNNIFSKISFHGYTDKPLEVMKSLDCVVVPSRKESFGLVALEAMAVGTPVAAFKGTGVNDFLREGQNGCMATMGDTVGLAGAVVRILKNPQRWGRMSNSGINMVAAQYSLKKHITSLEDIYEQLFTEQQEKTAYASHS